MKLLLYLLLIPSLAFSQVSKKQMFYMLANSSASSQSAIDAGAEFLQDNSIGAWDFLASASTEYNSLITSVPDLRATNAIVNSKYPRLNAIQSEYNIKKSFESRWLDLMQTTSALSINQSFTMLLTVAFEDFQVTSLKILGVQDAAFNNGVQLWCEAGVLKFKYAAGGNQFTMATSAAILNDGIVGETLIQVNVDFTANTAAMYVDGVDYSVSVTSGSVAGVDPTAWSIGSLKLCVGGHNTNGTLAGNVEKQYFTRLNFSPLIGASDIGNVISYMISTSYDTGATLTIDTNYTLQPIDYNDLMIWYDADDPLSLTFDLTTGNNVNRFFDKSGLAAYAVESSGSDANKPAYNRKTGLHGRSYIQWNTSTAGLLSTAAGTASVPTELSAANKVTMISVHGPHSRVEFASASDQNKRFFQSYFTDNVHYTGIFQQTGTVSQITHAATAGAVDCHVDFYDGTQSTNATKLIRKINNADVTESYSATVPTVGPTVDANWSFGLGVAPSNPAGVRGNGRFYETIWFSRVLTTQEWDDLYNYYIKPKYDL